MVRCLVYCSYFRLFLLILFLSITGILNADSTTGGIFEGGKYKSYIAEIIKIAEQKRKPLEDELDRTVLRKEVLEESKESIKFVQSALDSLFGLRNVFHTSVATSSNSSVVTAITKKGAKSANMELVVQQIAEADQFYSDSLALDYKIPAGQYEFEIGGQGIDLNYPGGNLDDFAENLSKINPDHLKASVIKSSPGQQVFLLSGQKTSESMHLNFKGKTKEWALEVGILTDSLPMKYVVVLDSFDLRSQSAGKTFDMKRGADLGPGRYLEIRPDSTIPLKIAQDSYLSFEYKKDSIESKSEVNLPQSSDYTKKEAAREGFIISSSNNNTVDLPRIPDQPNIYLNSNGKLVLVNPVNLQSDFTSMRIELSEYKVSSIQSIVLYNGGDCENFQIKNLQLVTPAKGKGDFFPKNVVSRAQDAKFTLDGVTINRPVNEIKDVSSDFTFNLKSVDPNPVTISIKQDIDSAIRDINDFITVYNYHISKLNIFTSVKDNHPIIQEISFPNDEERKKAEERLGVYQGDSQMIQMKRHLFFLMVEPYLVGIERSKKLLIKELGIHTGNKLGIVGDSSQRRGYFEVDQVKLREKLEMNWDEVRDFFASYTGDSVISDDGLAVKMRNYLQSFLGRDGLLSERVRILEKQIEKNKKTITDFNTKLEEKKKKMESDFMKVQSAEAELERFSKQMDSFFPNK